MGTRNNNRTDHENDAPVAAREDRVRATRVTRATRTSLHSERTDGDDCVSQVIAFFNQKGGTAKTTSTLNIGAALAERGHSVLAIDLDPQASLTMALGIDIQSLELSSYDLLVDEGVTAAMIAQPTRIPGFSLIPSHPDLAVAELELLNALERERSLSRKLSPKARKELGARFILIDCPPSLNIVSINILVAMDYLVIPIEPHPLSIIVLPRLFDTVGRVRRLNPTMRNLGFLPTKVHGTSRLAKEMIVALHENFPDLAVLSSIPLSVQGAQSVAQYSSILDYSPRSPVAEAYRRVARELEKAVCP